MQETSHVDRTNLTSLHVLFGRPTPSKKPLKTEKIPNHIEFHTIEFSWNYDQYMSRFHLQTPTRGAGKVMTLGLSKWKFTKGIWNKTIEPWFVDLLDNFVGSAVRGFIKGLRVD